uniref:Uncharacterized protein n=1 Tax=Euplotes harpa TaxID=151035 RepID=A0A7S3NAM6_9SPIT
MDKLKQKNERKSSRSKRELAQRRRQFSKRRYKDDSESSIHRERKRKTGIYYISEEDTVTEESSVYDDILVPVCNDDSSISYSNYRKAGKIYLNSKDELVHVAEEHKNEAPKSWHNIPKANNTDKLYKERELEAAKFVEAIDNAVYQFKLHKVLSFEKNQGIKREHNQEEKKIVKNIKELGYGENKKKPKEQIQRSTLKDLYKADLKHLSPKARKIKLRDFEEVSVRLEKSDKNQSHFGSRKSSTSASEDVVVDKKKKSAVYKPGLADLKQKNDYIFFELFSVFTENYINGKKQRK